MTRFHRIAWICILYSLINTCQSLKCLQCESVLDIVCHMGQSEPKECTREDHKYCITYSGSLPGSNKLILFRNCSIANMTSECQMVTVSDKSNETKPMRFWACYNSCDTDGCNRDVHKLSGFDSSAARVDAHRNFAVTAAVVTVTVLIFVTAFV